MNTKYIAVLTIATAASAFADTLAVGQNNKLDLAPVAVVSQALPTLKVGKDANKDNGVLSVGVNGGVGVNLPYIAANATLGSVSVGPEQLNVKVGAKNSVTVGPVTLGQALPTALIGTEANKNGWFDISLKNGLGITLPFVSLNVTLPTLAVAKAAAAPAAKPAAVKK